MRFYIYTLFLLSMALPTFASPINLDEVTALSIAKSPLAYQIKAQTASDFADGLDNNTLQNPEVEFVYRADKSSEVELSQPLRVSDILLDRYSYKQSLKHLKSLEQQLDLLRITHTVSEQYYILYALQQEIVFLKKQLSLAFKVQESTDAAMLSDLSSTEMLVLKIENQTLDSQIKRLEKKLVVQRRTFCQSLGLPDTQITLLAPPAFFVPKTLDFILNRLPDFPNQEKILALRYEQAQDRLNIIQKDRWMPTISPKLGLGIRSFDRKDDWNVGIGLSIPLWDYSSGKAAAAKMEAKSYETQLEAMKRLSFDEMIQKQFDVLKELHTQLRFYQKQILPEFQNALEKIDQNFMNGSASALDLLQVREKENAAQKQYLDILIETNAAKNELEMMIGARLEDLK